MFVEGTSAPRVSALKIRPTADHDVIRPELDLRCTTSLPTESHPGPANTSSAIASRHAPYACWRLLLVESVRPEDFRVHLHDGRDLDFTSYRLSVTSSTMMVTAPHTGCTISRREPSRTTAFCLLLFDTAGT